jgi:hypothetical protein
MSDKMKACGLWKNAIMDGFSRGKVTVKIFEYLGSAESRVETQQSLPVGLDL